MRTKLILASALMLANLPFAYGAETKVLVASAENTTSSETYLGAIHYQGGLLERGMLHLQQPAELQYIRFEIPNFCQPQIFEAGTVTEGVADLADATETSNVFAVNGGRGIRARSVFLSLNGPDNSSCHILVYSRTAAPTPAPEPTPGDGHETFRAVSCIVNELNVPMIGQISTDGVVTPFSAPAFTTSTLVTTLRADRSVPHVRFSFDSDLSAGYRAIYTPLVSNVQTTLNCGTAPTYALRLRPYTSIVDFVRVH